MKKYIFSVVAFLLFTNYVFGCSLYIPPTSDFDTGHYIFIGEIVEVLENVKYESQGIKNEAVGFKVKVSENIYSPKQADYFEIFPLQLTASCGLMSDIKQLRERFSVGSQVRVVAKETTVFKNQSAGNSIVRLETSIHNHGSFSRNDVSENLRASAKSVYDYNSFAQKQRATADNEFAASNHRLPEFELRKDLFRLKETKYGDEKIKILERLVFYPHVHRLNYTKIVRTYIKNQDKIAALEKHWEQRVNEIYPIRH